MLTGAVEDELMESFESVPTAGKDKDESIYESAASSSSSSSTSSPASSKASSERESSDSEVETFKGPTSGQCAQPLAHSQRRASDDASSDSDSSSSDFTDNSSSVSLIEEDLEAKRRQLRKKAKRLLKKNKKLRESFKITADCTIANIKEPGGVNLQRSSKDSDDSFRSEPATQNTLATQQIWVMFECFYTYHYDVVYYWPIF